MKKGYKLFLFFLGLVFIIGCSVNKRKVEKWCEDIFIPGNEYYEINVQHQQGYEIPPVIKAESFLPENMRKTDIYEVDSNVYSDGTIDHFEIKTKWGRFRIAGILRLKLRLNEINALAALENVSAGEAILDGIKGTAKGIIMSPVKLSENIGSFFKEKSEDELKEEEENERKFQKIKEKEEKTKQENEKLLAENNNEALLGGDDDEVSENVSKLKNILETDTDYITRNTAPNEEKQGTGFLGGFTGTNKEIVAIQQKFNIDPYTDNELLRSEISRVASIRAGTGLAASVIPVTPVISILNSTASTAGFIGGISIYEDEKTQEKKAYEGLRIAGCSDKLIEKFQNHPYFTTYMRTIIVNSILYMKKAKERHDLIKLLLAIEDYETAWIYTQCIMTLPSVYDTYKITRFINDSPISAGLTSDNDVVISFAGDHLYWSREMDILFRATLNAIRDNNIVPRRIIARITGIPSIRVQQEIRNLGVEIDIQENEDKFKM